MNKVIVNIGEEDSDKYFVYKHKNKRYKAYRNEASKS